MDHVLENLPKPLTPGHLVALELIELKTYDKAHDTLYFETLKAYLLAERDIPRTTLLYRLK